MNETDKKSGKPDKPQKSRLNLWISDKTSESLDTLAKERGVSASSIAETALRLYPCAILFTVTTRRIGRYLMSSDRNEWPMFRRYCLRSRNRRLSPGQATRHR